MNLPIEIEFDQQVNLDAELWKEESKHRPRKKHSLGRPIAWAHVIGLLLIITYFFDWVPLTGVWVNVWLVTGVLLLLSIPIVIVVLTLYSKIFSLISQKKKENKQVDPNQVIKRLIFRANHLEIVKAGGILSKPWNEVAKIEYYPSFVLIYPDNKLSYIFPKEYFSDDQLAAIKSFLDQWPTIEQHSCYPPEEKKA